MYFDKLIFVKILTPSLFMLQGDRISMNRQLLNHQVTILKITSILGNVAATRSLLNKCLYTVDMGNNDYLNNYLEPRFYPSSQLFSPDRFATILVQQFEGQLRVTFTTN